jgi:glycosyltransferase involved in cell wall biosynthesis
VVIFFIHQNFPAQYVHVAAALAQNADNRVYFITQSPAQHQELAGVTKLIYKLDGPARAHGHPYTASLELAVRTGVAVADVCRVLRERGIVPDLIVGHCGWGETLFVKSVFAHTPLLSNFEFFYHAEGADVGFDSEFAPARADDAPRLQVRNTVNRLSYAGSDWGHTATAWQRSLFPLAMQAQLSIVHEGVNTRELRPDPDAWLKLARGNVVLTRRDEVITYAARNLEPYRGFHIFMRALPQILRRRPRAHVLIAGGDGVSYGEPPPHGSCFREMMLAEVGRGLDQERVHFLGHISYAAYRNLLQLSSVHVYLSYPFVLSWSFVEALSAGCLLLASATAPVLEVLRDGHNGLAVDFFSVTDICDRIDAALEHPDRMQALREAARATAIRDFDLETHIMPRWLELLSTLAAGRRPTEQPPSIGLATRLALR